MAFFSCQTRCNEAMAFPSRLRSTVQEAVIRVVSSELHPPRYAFMVTVEGETLSIPDRLYYSPEVLRQELSKSQGTAKLILLCLGTRHYDGYLRQECLRKLLDKDEAWLVPYLVQLSGEYVVEIVDDVAKNIAKRNPAVLATFASENPAYLATLSRRVTSYWSCYYRHIYPDRASYPGAAVISTLKKAADAR